MHTAEQTSLLAWGARTRRPLPWRASRDPWEILVSEVMAQQTQVARVVPKWEAFLERWPTPDDAARASLGEILELWQGLGYPRRAKALWETAALVSQRGGFPTELADLLALPGIGGYTARAIQAFAYEFDVGVVDTNIARVLARRVGHRLTPREAQAEADRFVPTGEGWAHNQSLMDLGNQHCRPTPVCDGCPISAWCSWSLEGYPSPDPAAGSAGVSGRQAAFEGSDRQGRGRLLAALHNGPVSDAALATVMGWPDDAERAGRVSASLVSDGLAVHREGAYRLP